MSIEYPHTWLNKKAMQITCCACRGQMHLNYFIDRVNTTHPFGEWQCQFCFHNVWKCALCKQYDGSGHVLGPP